MKLSIASAQRQRGSLLVQGPNELTRIAIIYAVDGADSDRDGGGHEGQGRSAAECAAHDQSGAAKTPGGFDEAARRCGRAADPEATGETAVGCRGDVPQRRAPRASRKRRSRA